MGRKDSGPTLPIEAEPVPETVVEAVAEPAPKVRPPLEAMPSTVPDMTAERVFNASRVDPIVQAFLTTVKLAEATTGTRKQPRSAWLAELDTFKTAPR